MTIQGITTYICDSGSGACITPSWVANLTALGVKHARVVVQASSTNIIRYDLLARGAILLRDAGISVLCVLPVEADAPWTEADPTRRVYPNEDLGYHGNKRQNRFIAEFCVRAAHIARTLVPCGVTRFCVGNEQNLLGCIPVGNNVPPVAGQKAPATSPEVWASLCYEASGWLKVAGATEVLMGALSWLPIGSPADIGWHDNNWTTRYVSKGLAHLHTTGVKALPFAGICTNSEEAWTIQKAQAMRSALTGAITSSGYADLPLTVSEWSFPCHGSLDTAKAQETAAALASVASEMYFFTGPLDPAGYGAHGWTVAGSGFVPSGERTPWWPVVAGLVAG